MRRLSTLTGLALSVLLAASAIGSSAWGQGKWECPAAEKSKKSPVPGGAQAVGAGKKVVGDKACAVCHGEGGKGDGPGAAALNPKPADWTSAAVQSETDGCLFWKISNGRGAMPPWKESLSEADRWNLVQYLRTFKKK